MKAPQLLAPAGDFTSVDAALAHGADALYIGLGAFNLRAHAPNFAPEDLPELLERVHTKGRHVYYALNIMPDMRQIREIEALLDRLSGDGTLPDAFIASDPGVIHLCRELVPETPLHLSTQTGSFNQRSLRFWKELGIKRVVLPRELTLEQVAGLAAMEIMETEIFIHGAMCVSISGRCLMGAYMAGRHPNRGDCPQPCRWNYRITPCGQEKGQPTQVPWLDVEEDASGTFLLNARDLCTLSILPDCIGTGVSALKIEGRNKSAHYIAAVVKSYRAAIDDCIGDAGKYTVADEWAELLEAIDHRPYTTGFYTGELQMQEVFTSKASSGARIVGVVKGLLPGGIPVIDVKNSFNPAEPLEILPVNQTKIPYIVVFQRCTDLAGNELERIPSNRLIVVYCADRIQPGDMVRLRNTS